ncbi:unnamed protein product [Ectocarpus sp. 6 AP-2014]
MQSPSRCVPPPPSDPPPPNISRSGRVPPPRGAPPGGARRARQAVRRPLHPQARDPTGDRESAGQHDDRQGFSRRGDLVQSSPSHEGSPSDASSRESFEGSLSSDNERGSHPLPAVRKRQNHRSLGANSTSPRNGREELVDRRRIIPGERGSRRHRNRQQGAGPDRRSSRLESSSWSSDDVSNAKTDAHQGTRGRDGTLRKEERREAWDRNEDRHSPRELHDTARSNSSHRRQRDTLLASGVGSEESQKRRDVNRKSHKKHVHQHQRANNSHRTKHREDSDRVGPDRPTSSPRGSTAEEMPRLGILEDSDSRSRTQEWGGSPERPKSNTGESRRGRRNRRSRRKRAEQDDSEAEGYGWSGNKYSWDSADVDSTGSSSDQQELTKLNPNGGDGKQRPKLQSLGTCTDSNKDEDRATHTTSGDNNTAAAAPEKLFRSPDRTRGKLDDSGAWGSDREQDGAIQKLAGSSGSGHGPTQPSMNSDVKSLPQATVNRAEVAVGKPIRGARWGESIGVRSAVFDSSTIPTKRVDLKRFVSGPLNSGPGTVLRCFIERDRNGTHKFSPVFSMYADLGDGSGRMLLAARKLLASKTAYYTICTRQEDLFKDNGKRGGNSFLAKLRASSVAHTEYALYDRGDNPAVAASETSLDSGAEAKPKSMRNPIDLARSKTLRNQERHGQGEVRRELGVIIYNFDKKEQRTGKRRMEVAIPQLEQEGDS